MEKFDKAIIEENLKKILMEVFEEKYFNINGGNIAKYIEVSSFEAIQIIAYIEDRFLIEIEDKDLSADFITTIDELTEYIYVHQ